MSYPQETRINSNMDSQVKRLLAKAVEYENMKRELAEAKRLFEESKHHLKMMLDEHEGLFECNGQFGSVEFGEDYLEAAKFAEAQGRKYTPVAEQQWVENQLK